MIVLIEGAWREVEVLGLGNETGDGLLPAEIVLPDSATPPPPAEGVRFQALDTFSPILLAAVGTAVEWVDDSTGTVASTSLTPTLPVGSWTLRGDLAGIHTLNLGFNASEDAGRLSPGAGYNYEPRQPVSQIDAVNRLTGLVRLLAATPTLRGHLELSGMAALEFVECYRAQVESTDLTGCTSLTRLCFEQNNLTSLDLTPVRTTLTDLRAAAQTRPGLVLTCTGNMEVLYHYCTRANPGSTQIPIEQLSVVEQWWTWNCQLVDVGIPTSPLLYSCRSYGNALTTASVDNLLIWISENMSRSTGNVRLNDGTNSPPSATGAAAADVIRAGGWSVELNA